MEKFILSFMLLTSCSQVNNEELITTATKYCEKQHFKFDVQIYDCIKLYTIKYCSSHPKSQDELCIMIRELK